ncbi:MAG TPA: hypothetical protein DCR55_02495 [Lentisphaeria bacterium]|nr:hypothetical protein [Lentisphaeria bacterium]
MAFCEFEIDADPPGCSINTTGFFAPASWSGSVTGTTTGTDVAHLTVTIQRRSDLAYFAGNRWQGNGVEKKRRHCCLAAAHPPHLSRSR